MSPGGPDALTGLRVVEATEGIAGGYATKLLADLGADVVKVERQGGDPLRRWVACRPDEPSEDDGALFSFLNTSKRAIAAEHTELCSRLIGWADVIVCQTAGPDLLPGSPEGWRQEHPGLSVVTLRDIPGTGAPEPTDEFTLQAWAGVLSACQGRDGPPLQMGAGPGVWATGATAAVAVLAADAHRTRTGAGLACEVSGLEVMSVCLLNYPTLYRQFTGAVAKSSGDGDCLSVRRCRDGWIGLCVFTAQQWADFATLIGRPDLADDSRLSSMGPRSKHRDVVDQVVQPWLDAHDADEITALSAAFRVPCAPIGSGRTVFAMDHLTDRGVFVSNPAGFRQPRPPFQLSATPTRTLGPVPAPDADADVELGAGLAAAGHRATDLEPGPPAAEGGRPLEGLVVLDLTAFWAGPAATHLLATLGADVIKIESHRRPDGMRYASVGDPADPSWVERSPTFHGTNPGKRSVTVDFSVPAGRDLLLRLVEHSDVVVENFTPRVLDNAGLSYPVLSARRPGLVVARMPGFGLTGPWRDRSGFAQTMEQVSGITWLTGAADQVPLARSTVDPISGMHAAVAVLAALRHRALTGEGQLVEVPMVEVALNVAAEQSVTYSAYGEELSRDGNRGPGGAPQGVYRCAGANEWMALSVATDQQWEALLGALGPAPPRSGDPTVLGQRAGRRSQHDQIDAWLADRLATEDPDKVVSRLLAAGVPAARVWPHSLLDEQPALVASGFFQELEHPVVGRVELPGTGIRAHGVDLAYRSTAPTVGQHTVEVLTGLLGCDQEEMDALAAAGAIGPLRAD